MKGLRAVVVVAVLVAAAYLAYRYLVQPTRQSADTITVYYCKTDGETLSPWKVSLRQRQPRESSAEYRNGIAFYATAQALAGPPSSVEAIRFPLGTVVRSVKLDGSTALVDLGGTIAHSTGGSFAETGEFKALVWTLTALPGISSVRVEVDGAQVATLPGGHLELDQPLARSSF
jgi:spore germination protein GerM